MWQWHAEESWSPWCPKDVCVVWCLTDWSPAETLTCTFHRAIGPISTAQGAFVLSQALLAPGLGNCSILELTFFLLQLPPCSFVTACLCSLQCWYPEIAALHIGQCYFIVFWHVPTSLSVSISSYSALFMVLNSPNCNHLVFSVVIIPDSSLQTSQRKNLFTLYLVKLLTHCLRVFWVVKCMKQFKESPEGIYSGTDTPEAI